MRSIVGGYLFTFFASGEEKKASKEILALTNVAVYMNKDASFLALFSPRGIKSTRELVLKHPVLWARLEILSPRRSTNSETKLLII